MDAVVAVLGKLAANGRIRVVQIAVEARSSRAVVHAGRLRRAVGRKMLAQGTLARHAVRLGEGAYAIGAGVQAVLAADALGLVHQHDARLAVAVARARWAHFHAASVSTLLALDGQVVAFDVGVASRGANLHHAVIERAQRQVVLELATDNAAVAPRAAIKIDDQAFPRHGGTPPPCSARLDRWA